MKSKNIDESILETLREHLRNPEISASNTLDNIAKLATTRPSALLYPNLTHMSDSELGMGVVAGVKFRVLPIEKAPGKFNLTFYLNGVVTNFERSTWPALYSSTPYNPPHGADYYIAGFYLRKSTISNGSYDLIREGLQPLPLSAIEVETLIYNLTGVNDWVIEDHHLSIYDDKRLEINNLIHHKEDKWLSCSVPDCFKLRHYLNFCTDKEIFKDALGEEESILLYQVNKSGEETVVGKVIDTLINNGVTLVKVEFTEAKKEFIDNFNISLMKLSHRVELGVSVTPNHVTFNKCYLIEEEKRK